MLWISTKSPDLGGDRAASARLRFKTSYFWTPEIAATLTTFSRICSSSCSRFCAQAGQSAQASSSGFSAGSAPRGSSGSSDRIARASASTSRASLATVWMSTTPPGRAAKKCSFSSTVSWQKWKELTESCAGRSYLRSPQRGLPARRTSSPGTSEASAATRSSASAPARSGRGYSPSDSTRSPPGRRCEALPSAAPRR